MTSVFAWYRNHALPVTPINPSPKTTAVLGVPTVASVRALLPVGSEGGPGPAATSVSFVTPPAVTRTVLAEATAAGVRQVWMQPGSWDAECVRFARDECALEAVVYGHEAELGYEGACVLVHGEMGLRAAGRL